MQHVTRSLSAEETCTWKCLLLCVPARTLPQPLAVTTACCLWPWCLTVCVVSGKEVAAGLLRRGQHVVLTCRSAERCHMVRTPGNSKACSSVVLDTRCSRVECACSQWLASMKNGVLHI